jgi:hypothetical protein
MPSSGSRARLIGVRSVCLGADVFKALDYEDDDFGDFEGGEMDEGDDDDDEDNDPDFKPPAVTAGGAPGQKPECKQS